MDKIQELEERLNNLEKKTKATFTEVEKRLAVAPEQLNVPEAISDRLNELEDLLLLSQVENTKLKDMIAGTQNVENIESGDIGKRLNKIEEKVYSMNDVQTPLSVEGADYSEELEQITKRLDDIEQQFGNGASSGSVKEEMPSDIHDRLNELEEKIQQVGSSRDDSVTDRLTELEEKLEKITGLRTSTPESDSSIKEMEDNLERSLGNLEQRIKTLETRKPPVIAKEKPYHAESKVIIMPDKNVLLDVQKILEGN